MFPINVFTVSLEQKTYAQESLELKKDEVGSLMGIMAVTTNKTRNTRFS